MENKIVLSEMQCNLCNHNWIPRQSFVLVCPKCKSPRWNKDVFRIKIQGKNFEEDCELLWNSPFMKEAIIDIGNCNKSK